MLPLVHKIASWVLKRRMTQIEAFIQYPHEVQFAHFQKLMDRAKSTKWGQKYGYASIDRVETFQENVPISSYEQLFPWIERTLKGESDVLWPGKTEWFSKSSGTTNDKSKYIPVSFEALEDCHFKAGQDALAMYLHNKPESKLFTGKSLSVGGSHSLSPFSNHARVGDVSAVITENLPRFFELMRAPSREIALMAEWEPKIEAMVNAIIDEDITGIAGVPTWTLVLIHRMFEKLGMTEHNLLEIWPNIELFLHGGVNFQPYRKQFEALIPTQEMTYLDVYNASEGFFAVQSEIQANDMLLMLDYGIFYEFIPIEHLHENHPKTYTLDQVEIGQNYALVISTNAGLWRYLIGDTVAFTSLSPYKIRVTGRTKQFINAFGEEVVMENAEIAMSHACQQSGAIVRDYTVAPLYFSDEKSGGHEWLVEFVQTPNSLDHFCRELDKKLREINSDYDAKRTADIALGLPLIRPLPDGTFHQWMKGRGKLGGQHKVPRLSNNRKYVEDILSMMAIN